MPGWAGSNRRRELPADWPRIRRRILKRDGGRCRSRLDDESRCPAIANQVDHIIPSGSDADENLQSLCAHHHGIKSAQEGAAAGRAKKALIAKRFKNEERHPGLL
jgi:5-methylcytosine-specific restriction endonuclease McrA